MSADALSLLSPPLCPSDRKLSWQDWETLDAETATNKQKLNQLPEKFVLILRDKAMQARIRAHHARINRFSKEAIAERKKTPGGGVAAMMANLHAKKPGQ